MNTPDIATLAAAIERLEAAPGADRELDYLIALAVRHDYGSNWISFRSHEGAHGYQTAFTAHRPWLDAHTPRYTASFEDALTLIPPGKDYQLTGFGCGPDGGTYSCFALRWWPRPDDKHGWRSESGNKLTASLALCIAALKVRHAQIVETSPAAGVKP